MKIAIVGAGINGLYLAWKLSGMGHKVVVFEKRNKIGKESCSGLFSRKILEFIPQSKKLIQNEINFALIHFPKKSLKVNFSREFFVISHFELDKLVADLARTVGAEILLSQKNLKKENLLAYFDRVIGSDGANSVVRKWLNLPKQKFRLGIQSFVKNKDHSNYVETWPVNQGFIWKIPRGEEVEYGAIGDPKEVVDLFKGFLNRNNIGLKETKSALVPQGLSIPLNNRITLSGDAAGLTKPWSGGGVIWGLISADLLLRSFPDFLEYRSKLRKFFSAKIIFSKMAVKTVYFLGFNIPWLLLRNTKIKNDFLI